MLDSLLWSMRFQEVIEAAGGLRPYEIAHPDKGPSQFACLVRDRPGPEWIREILLHNHVPAILWVDRKSGESVAFVLRKHVTESSESDTFLRTHEKEVDKDGD